MKIAPVPFGINASRRLTAGSRSAAKIDADGLALVGAGEHFPAGDRERGPAELGQDVVTAEFPEAGLRRDPDDEVARFGEDHEGVANQRR